MADSRAERLSGLGAQASRLEQSTQFTPVIPDAPPQTEPKAPKPPKPPRRPGRARKIVGRSALAVGLTAATYFGGRTILDGFSSDPNGVGPTPSLTDEPTGPITSNPSPTPSETVSPTPTETAPVVQPTSDFFEMSGEAAPYGYLTKRTVGDVTSVYMLGKILDIDQVTNLKFEGKDFKSIKLFLGLDEDGKRIVEEFVLGPSNSDYKTILIERNGKELPFSSNFDGVFQQAVNIDTILSQLSLQQEVVIEFPVENNFNYQKNEEKYGHLMSFRFNRFAKDNLYSLNRNVVDRTPLGDEANTQSILNLGLGGTIIVRT